VAGCEGLNLGLRPGDSCPVCGEPIAWLECRRVKSKVKGLEREHIYIFAWHTRKENGQLKRSKCYLGAYRYDYVARKHIDVGMTLMGMALGPQRIAQYIEDYSTRLLPAIESGTLDVEQARKLLAGLKDSVARLQALVDRLDGYVRLHSEDRGD
jgi:hypothetical protein